MFLHHTVLVPVNGITKATAGALVYATTIGAAAPIVVAYTSAPAVALVMPFTGTITV